MVKGSWWNRPQVLWSYVWDLVQLRMGNNLRKKEKVFGYDLFLALVTLYRRFLYNVNSGKTDLNLIKSYKQLLFEKIYIEYITGKSEKYYTFLYCLIGRWEGLI
jgi:hypothetical protein